MSHPNEREEFYVWNGTLYPREGSVGFSPLSDGLLYGIGCFETMALADGVIRFEADHRKRFEGALEGLGLGPLSWGALVASVSLLAEKNKCGTGMARISVHADEGKCCSLVRVFPGGNFAGKESLRVGLSRFGHPGPSPLSRWKHNNYALNVLTYREGLTAGFDEVVLRRNGRYVEGAMSNLWVLIGKEMRTPPLEDGALGGVVRGRLLGLEIFEGVSFVADTVPEDRIKEADGVFLSNAGMLLKPVCQWDGRELMPARDLALSINARLRL